MEQMSQIVNWGSYHSISVLLFCNYDITMPAVITMIYNVGESKYIYQTISKLPVTFLTIWGYYL